MSTPPFDRLTPRELRIVQLLAQGCSNRQIAAELFLSVNTIKTHVGRILDKTDSKNRAEAVGWLMLDERFRKLHQEPLSPSPTAAAE